MKKTPAAAPVKHLLVDLDGTLLGNRNLNLSYDFLKQTLSAMRVYGGVASTARLIYSIGKDLRKTGAELTNDVRIVEIFSRQANISIEEARRVLRESVLAIFPTLEKHFYPIQGAKDFLDWAKTRYPLTLATNPVWPPEIIELRVKWAGIDPGIFSAITHVRKMHAYKPSLDYYTEILAQQGLAAEDCLLIGDNVKMDLPATRAGIRVFIVQSRQSGQRGQRKQERRGKSDNSDLKLSKALAPAWRGSYPELKMLLEGLPPV